MRESKEQEQLFNVCRYIKECEFMFHVPNGGSRNLLEAINLKRQGVKAGVPDVCLPVSRGGYHGLFIELKVRKNKTTKPQSKYIDYLNSEGYLAVVCYGHLEALETIKNYLKLKVKSR